MENCRVVPDARSCTMRVPKIPSARSVPGTMPRSFGLEQFSFAGCQVVSYKRLLPAKTTASGRVTRRASSDPACLSHSRQGLGRLSHDSG